MTTPTVHPFHHAPTGTWSYVVADPIIGVAAIVDPVLDFDLASGKRGTSSAQKLLDCVQANGYYGVQWILETHAHADHLSAAPWLQLRTGAPVAIGEGIREVQAHFSGVFGFPADYPADDSLFDRLFAAGERFTVGSIAAEVIPVPGHTPDSVAYLVGDALFVGDSIFMPDAGTARCDFPGGDAATLYRSIRRLFELPDATRVFVCHDYGPGGREPRCETTIARQRAENIHVRDGVDEAHFVAQRTARDATLAVPALLLPAVQVNVHAGRFPPADADGRISLSLPIDRI
jgi:glyoxylase-like metal-dependent hydrolase (beta-lactamase superfamily II)